MNLKQLIEEAKKELSDYANPSGNYHDGEYCKAIAEEYRCCLAEFWIQEFLEKKMRKAAEEAIKAYDLRKLSGCQCHICSTSKCSCGIEYFNGVVERLDAKIQNFLKD